MLRIRQTQRVALVRPQLQRSADQLQAHVREYFPERCAELGPEEASATTLRVLERAWTLGFKTRRDATRLVNLVFRFGEALLGEPWAKQVLEDESIAPSFRIMRLRLKALDRAEGVHVR